MKKKIFTFAVIALVIYFGCSGCSGCSGCKRDYVKEFNEYIKECQKEGNEALDNGDFPGAYAAADNMLIEYPGDKDHPGYSFNRKVLSAEIANTFDGESDNNTTAAKIILVVKERARYNSYDAKNDEDDRRKAEMEMLELAIQVAQANGNDDIATKLQTALDSWDKENKK